MKTNGDRAKVWGGGGLAIALVTCIIPDRDIQIESDLDNPGAVRIVEPTPLVQELRDACQSDEDSEEFDPTACPQIPNNRFSLRQGIVPGGPYCSCPEFDGRNLPESFIYAEDPDRRRDRRSDTLYAVALLDLDPLSDAPQTFVAYPEHLFPGGEGEYFTSVSRLDEGGRLFPSTGREDNGIWRFRFGKDGGIGVDLCNDDDGKTLPVGLHNLRVIVTDRPFFHPVRLDEQQQPVLDSRGNPLRLRPQFGVPDLAAGATWASANYVFKCHDPGLEPACECVEEAP